MHSIKTKIESILDCRIYRNSMPHGTDLFFDLKRSFTMDMFRTVFDIGANVGQSALKYITLFPNADIYSFEPVKSTYSQLVSNTKHHSRIHPFHIGMGKEKGSLKININSNSTINSLLRPSENNSAEEITIDTVADFCSSQGIQSIDFLKTDTEGYDLFVLEGCKPMLQKQQIKVVMVECEPVATSNYFVSIEDLGAFLSPFGYKLFGIYEQQLDWDGKKSVLFFNAVFVCPELIHYTLRG
ncbi:MAG TPA: FkbM family methyltransferase [Flavisolibacter sp.]|jgi:FkbM family methyltransferase|nr:FkbM family methyltransferase [Flavisolibacter sp.]